MRSLSTGTNVGITADVTRPGYLVEIGFFATPLRLSSRGTLTWDGHLWTQWEFRLSGLAFDGSQSAQNGTIEIGDSDQFIAHTCLTQGVSDRTVKVWAFYTEAPGLSDPILVFSGVGDSCSIDPSAGRVRVDLVQSSGAGLYCPRRYITREQGFGVLPSPGTIVVFGHEVYTLVGGDQIG